MGTAAAPVAERRELGPGTDHELVAAVRRGDDRAFERLYERYQRRIAAYVYGMVNDYGRAEDITQEVFISALRRMRETERPIAFKPWIYEIAKNACIDQFRRSRRAEEISFDAEDGAGALENARLAAPGATPDAAIDAKQQLDHLCGAFGGLSETHHQILVLRELEGLSYREIGERLNLSRPSVESTLFRARRRLAEEYDELVSGERCARIQTIIGVSAEGSLGARDQRRLARHIAHCQPCRRQARLAGMDTATLTRSLRESVAAKVAAFLPLPGLMRFRRADSASGAEGQGAGIAAQWSPTLASMAEPLAGWTKAAATAAAVIVAGGAGVAVHSATTGDRPEGVDTGVNRTTAPAKDKSAKEERDRSGASAATRSRSAAGARDRDASRAGAGAIVPGEADTGTGAAPPDPEQTAPQESLPPVGSGAPVPPSALRDAGRGSGGSPDEGAADDGSGSGFDPTVNTQANPLAEAENTATKLDGNAGQLVGTVREFVGE